jgi:RIO kinase 1
MLDSFVDSGEISQVLEFVKGGKEATVFRCRAGEAAAETFYAAKVYRPPKYRYFRDDAAYQNGRVILDARARRAVKKRTSFGAEAHQGLWVAAEYETQQMMYEARVDVPRPIACNGDAILMEWIGDASGPAPQLKDVRLEPREANTLFQRTMLNIERLLSNNRIHGDLSPFNVLYWERELKLIDFPQSVDPRMNANGYSLLSRDIENMCRYFAKFGVARDPYHIARTMWGRFVRGEL